MYPAIPARCRIERRPWCEVLALLALLACSALVRADEASVLDRALMLMDAGDYAAARALLAPLEDSSAGDPAFDALYGTALLETGDAALAVLALERAVLSDPRLAGARLDLAIAYYRSGASEDARRELVRLRSLSPPPAASRVIESYLARLQAAAPAVSRHYELDAGVGYDGNANGATALQSFLGFDLDERSREAESSFVELNGAAGIGKRYPSGLELSARARAGHRHNPDASFVDATSFDVDLAAVAERGRDLRALGLRAYGLAVDEAPDSHGLDLNGAWQRRIGGRWRIGVLGRIGLQRYGDALKVRDVDRALLGTTASRSFGAEARSELAVIALAGRDDAVQSGSRYDRRLRGLGVTAAWPLSRGIRASLAASWLASDYDESFFEADAAREDTLTQLSLSLNWNAAPGWVLSPTLRYYENDSNTALFEFDRLEFRLGAVRRW